MFGRQPEGPHRGPWLRPRNEGLCGRGLKCLQLMCISLGVQQQTPASWRARGAGSVMRPTDLWVRVYGDAAVLTGLVAGADTSGPRSRITKTFVRQQRQWRLAALHSSGISAR